MHETAHPEAVTVPRRYPRAKRISVIAGLDPSPFDGPRGPGLAGPERQDDRYKAVGFHEDLLDNRVGAARGLRHAMGGMVGSRRWSSGARRSAARGRTSCATSPPLRGTSCAVLMVPALDEDGTRAGRVRPEDRAEPQAFYRALDRVGTSRAEMVESMK